MSLFSQLMLWNDVCAREFIALLFPLYAETARERTAETHKD
jgi:hypothetical protein